MKDDRADHRLPAQRAPLVVRDGLESLLALRGRRRFPPRRVNLARGARERAELEARLFESRAASVVKESVGADDPEPFGRYMGEDAGDKFMGGDGERAPGVLVRTFVSDEELVAVVGVDAALGYRTATKVEGEIFDEPFRMLVGGLDADVELPAAKPI